MTYTFGDNTGVAATVDVNRAPAAVVTAAVNPVGGGSGSGGGLFDGVRLSRRGGGSSSRTTVRRHRSDHRWVGLEGTVFIPVLLVRSALRYVYLLKFR